MGAEGIGLYPVSLIDMGVESLCGDNGGP